MFYALRRNQFWGKVVYLMFAEGVSVFGVIETMSSATPGKRCIFDGWEDRLSLFLLWEYYLRRTEHLLNSSNDQKHCLMCTYFYNNKFMVYLHCYHWYCLLCTYLSVHEVSISAFGSNCREYKRTSKINIACSQCMCQSCRILLLVRTVLIRWMSWIDSRRQSRR